LRQPPHSERPLRRSKRLRFRLICAHPRAFFLSALHFLFLCQFEFDLQLISDVAVATRAACLLQPAHLQLQLLQRHREPEQTLSHRLASLINLNQPSAAFDHIPLF
jgi:hypothetical protein